MQLYALDSEGKKVAACQAISGVDYSCIECKGSIRVRVSPLGKLHFFHLRQETDCASSKKSEEHLLIQEFLKCQVQGAEQGAELEVHFSEINRIADVLWHEKKIVFEVQCSPITAQELRERTSDYEQAGLYVIWILLDKTFYRKKFFAATAYLQRRTHYYAKADVQENKVQIFDLVHPEHIPDTAGSSRRFDVDVRYLEKNLRVFPSYLAQFLSERASFWHFFTKGDLLWNLKEASFDALWKEIFEKSGAPRKENRPWPIISFLRSCWYFILESALRSR